MLVNAFKRWCWSGVAIEDTDTLTPRKLTNTLAALVLLAILSQLPVIVLFGQPHLMEKLLVVVVALCLIAQVPLCQSEGALRRARHWLIAGYSGYLVCASLLWPYDLNIQAFLLLAVMICPFLYSYQTSGHGKPVQWLLIGLYLLLEVVHCVRAAPASLEAQHLLLLANHVLLAVSVYACSLFVHHNVRSGWQKLQLCHADSESLLHRVLPSGIAKRLKQAPQKVAFSCHNVSVIFADMVGFSDICERMPAAAVVDFLNHLYRRFDALCEHYGIEKLKTNGDQYIAVAGVHAPFQQPASRACQFADAMHEEMHRVASAYGLPVTLRIGIASGPVVAGVIGSNRVSFDIWGKTVNLAARLEASGAPQTTTVCENTRQGCQSQWQSTALPVTVLKGFGLVARFRLDGQSLA